MRSEDSSERLTCFLFRDAELRGVRGDGRGDFFGRRPLILIATIVAIEKNVCGRRTRAAREIISPRGREGYRHELQ